MKSQKLWLGEGESLAGILFVPENEEGCRGTVVACHGFRGGKENGGRIESLARKLEPLGLRLLAFDFTGCGESKGQMQNITLSRQVADLFRVVDYVCDNLPGMVVTLGRSFGGSTVLAECAVDPRPQAVILWSTPISLADTFRPMLGEEVCDRLDRGEVVTLRDDYGDFALGPELLRDFANHDLASCLWAVGGRPLLVIHGGADEVVSPNNALLVRRIVPDCTVHIVPGADHKFLQHWQLREDLTVEWLGRVCQAQK